METLGVWLRQTREAKGVTLKEAEAATRVRARFLELLEAGDYAAFPGGEVQIRGFLRIYARYLGLPLDQVLARYEAETRPVVAAAPPGVPLPETPAVPPVRADVTPVAPEPRVAPATIPASPPHRLSTETVMIAGIALIVLLVVITAIGYIIGRNVEEPAPTATAPAQAARPTTATTAMPVATTPTFPANPGSGITLTLEASEHVWARVTVDGAVAFVGMLAPGVTPSWSGREMIAVDTGNGAGLRVTVNGQLQGTMCGRSQVCTRAWGPTGEIAATPPAPKTAP